ncbi:MAG: ferritin-like domain-containing protein [Acidimicrobiales bacterium]
MNDTTETMADAGVSPLQQMATAHVSRRRFLVGGGAVAGLVLVTAACGDDDEDTADDPDTGGDASGDLAVAKLAAGLEILAVDAYTAALSAATSGALGAVPPAVATFVSTAKGHHEEHRDAWNAVITGAGGDEVTEPNAPLKPTVDAGLAAAKTVVDAANLALTLENIASQTYLSAIPTLKSKDAITQAGQIQIVDQQHIAVLLFALGKYPVPEVFQKTDQAAKG